MRVLKVKAAIFKIRNSYLYFCMGLKNYIYPSSTHEHLIKKNRLKKFKGDERKREIFRF